MEHWKNLTSSVGPLGQKLTERFGALNQQAREHFGQTNDITELPDEYRELEDRVDALKNAQNVLIRAARAYEHEGYDYPHQLQESVTHGAQTLSHTLSAWAATATKNTSLPSVQPTNAPPTEPRTVLTRFPSRRDRGWSSLDDLAGSVNGSARDAKTGTSGAS